MTRSALAPARSDEETLTARATDGDRDAFAALYERYERRVYNVCYRILGSPEEAADATQEAFVNVLRRLPRMRGRELAFGSYVFKAARNASYDAVKRRGALQLTGAVSEAAVPVGGDPGAPVRPEDDPARSVMLVAQQDNLRRANARLPVRHREVLALRALGELSYDEIAAIMGMNRNSVAQLLSRARLRLRTELRGTAGGSIVPSGEDCSRALPLLAMADDNELRDERKALWLEAHMNDCARCELAHEVMAEAGESYRSWLPLVAVPWLLDAAEAEAAERAREITRRRRRRHVRSVAATATAMLITAGIAATTDGSRPVVAAPIPAAAVEVPDRAPERPRRPDPTRTPEPDRTPEAARTPEAIRTPDPEPTRESTSTPTSTPNPTRTARPTRAPAAIRTPEATRTPEPTSTPEPTPTPDPTPTAEPTATATPDPTRPATEDPPCSDRPRAEHRCPRRPAAGADGFRTPPGMPPTPQEPASDPG